MYRFDPDERPAEATAALDARLSRLTAALGDDDTAQYDPPDSVWDGIVAGLARGESAPDRPVVLSDLHDTATDRIIPDRTATDRDAGVVPFSGRRRTWSMPLAAAAAVVVLAGVVGAVVVSGDDRSVPVELAAAPLEALQPVVDVPDAASARAVAKLVERTDGTVHLQLDDAAMPTVPSGFHYEIWMVDAEVTDPRSLSDGSMAGRTDFVVPREVDPARYPIVDVSVEPDDGDPGHAGLDHSILRGRLQL